MTKRVQKLNEMHLSSTFMPPSFHDWMLGVFEGIEGCNTVELQNTFAETSIKTISELMAKQMLEFAESKNKQERTYGANRAVVLAMTLGTIIGKFGSTDTVYKSINSLREQMIEHGFNLKTESKFTEFKKVAAIRNAGITRDETNNLVTELERQLASNGNTKSEDVGRSAKEIITQLVNKLQADLAMQDVDTKGLKQ